MRGMWRVSKQHVPTDILHSIKKCTAFDVCRNNTFEICKKISMHKTLLKTSSSFCLLTFWICKHCPIILQIASCQNYMVTTFELSMIIWCHWNLIWKLSCPTLFSKIFQCRRSIIAFASTIAVLDSHRARNLPIRPQ